MGSIMTAWVVILRKYTKWFNLFLMRAICCTFYPYNPMKAAFQILLFLFAGSSLFAQQYYIRGEVKDESGNPLQDVNILLHATGYVYHTGPYGSFGILTNRKNDTLSFWLDGYQKEKRLVTPDNYVTVRLKLNLVSNTEIN